MQKPSSAETLARPIRRSSRIGVRAWALLIFLATAGILAVAVWLKPDPRGFGTHQQLGSGPCGMLVVTGFPCPTCSMTTAFAHTVRGQWLSAARVQPAGFLFALATALVTFNSAFTVVTGRLPAWWTRLIHRIPPERIFIAILIVLLAGWAYVLISGLASGALPLKSIPIGTAKSAPPATSPHAHK